MRLLKKISQFFRTLSEYGLSPLEIEIKRTRASLLRHQRALSQMQAETEDLELLCCCGCWMGKPYHDLCDKIERISSRLSQLQAKL